MREIKFRGYDYKNSKWYYGSLSQQLRDGSFMLSSIRTFISDEELGLHLVDNGTIGQYTGLKDKNGVEIYEGDIINDVDYGIMICKYINGSFVWQSIENELYIKLFNYIPNMEIIGNIYENKELLKEEGKKNVG